MSVRLVLGGARSGKSRYAESLARGQRHYVATAEAIDDEFKARISQHKLQRGTGWVTAEAPLILVETLAGIDKRGRFILVDCLTVWLGNLMHHGQDARAEVEQLASFLARAKSTIVLVSNEVGQGIVPDNAMARAFRDLQGFCNQRIAAAANDVTLVVAGIPVIVKSAKRRRSKAPKAGSSRRRKA